MGQLSNVDPDGGGGVEHTRIRELERNLLEARERATRLGSQMEFLTAHTAELEGRVECERGHSSSLQSDLKRASDRNAQLQEAVSVLEMRERESKTKYTLLWRMNCEQLSEYDRVITVKEGEIVTLKARNAFLERNQHSRPVALHEIALSPYPWTTGHITPSRPGHSMLHSRSIERESGGTETSSSHPPTLPRGSPLTMLVVGPGAVGPAVVGSGVVGLGAVGSGVVGPGAVGPAVVGSGVVGPGAISPTAVGSGVVGLGAVVPAVVGSRVVGPAVVGPAVVGSGVVSTGAISPTAVVPGVVGLGAEQSQTADSKYRCTPTAPIEHSSRSGMSQGTSRSHRGKAPPIDPFNGEAQDIALDDWIPAHRRVAKWNGWTEHETLIQLAGHMRGRALQDWNLLQQSEKGSLDMAISSLQSRLDPCSRVVAAQDFRHASQHDGELVANYIRRLEQIFRVAYGRETMSDETRNALLHSQLQEGLSYELMKIPAISGSHFYQELCLTAKNEKKRLAELKRRQYMKGPSTWPHVLSRVTTLRIHASDVCLTRLAIRRDATIVGKRVTLHENAGVDGQRVVVRVELVWEEMVLTHTVVRSSSRQMVTRLVGELDRPRWNFCPVCSQMTLMAMYVRYVLMTAGYARVLIEGVPVEGTIDS